MDTEKLLRNIIKAGFIILIARCAYLQIARYEYYKLLSQKNCIRTIELGTPRGQIYDRNNRILARDVPCFNIVFIPYDLRNAGREAELLSGLIGIREERLETMFLRRYINPFDRIVIKKNLTDEQMSLVEENASKLPGIFIQSGIDRKYTLGKDLCHILGYTREVSPSQLKKLKEEGVRSGDIIGQYGLESVYDNYLKGIPGGIQVEVNALGHQGRILGKKAMQPGNNLILTIDQTIQEIVTENLGEKNGCVIAMDPRNGQILALVSKPGFDPNHIEDYLTGHGHPFINRTIRGQYPPGSIFKIIVETASLEEGILEEYDRIECTGKMEVRNRIFHCWKEEGHGWIDINLALPFSCNIFFGTLGMKLGVRKMLEYARMFNLGEATEIDLPGESNGFLPHPYNIGPLNLAIGQGAILATPLQILSVISTVANDGNIWKPYLVKRIVSPEGKTVKEFFPQLKKTVYISTETLEILKRGLFNVVLFGTGHSAQTENLEIAGKTGTAQRAKSELDLPTIGVFTCYAPAKNPTIALIVFLDEASSYQAAKIAGNILKEIFFPKKKPEINTTIETDNPPGKQNETI